MTDTKFYNNKSPYILTPLIVTSNTELYIVHGPTHTLGHLFTYLMFRSTWQSVPKHQFPIDIVRALLISMAKT